MAAFFVAPSPVSSPLPAAPDDAALLAQAGDGRTEALAALYARHAGTVWRFAWLLTGSENAAADVVQDTFVALLERPVQYDAARGSVAAYLCGIARHRAARLRDERVLAHEDIDALADAAADAPVESGALTAALPELLADAHERRERLARLYAAIRALPPHYRDVLVLVELQEMSYADAALFAGIELGTVRSRLARARARLLELLRDESAIEDRKPA